MLNKQINITRLRTLLRKFRKQAKKFEAQEAEAKNEINKWLAHNLYYCCLGRISMLEELIEEIKNG